MNLHTSVDHKDRKTNLKRQNAVDKEVAGRNDELSM